MVSIMIGGQWQLLFSISEEGLFRMSDNSDLGRFGPWLIRTCSVVDSDL